MKNKAVIVDDEPLAIEIIETYINKLDDFEITAKCQNAVEAISILNHQKIDVIFLDIEMPEISGINFLRSLSHPPAVIITSAHREYALEGFELNVLDYLLKPIPFERFLKAIDKYYKFALQKEDKRDKTNIQLSTFDEFIYVKENKKNIKLYFDDIDYIEGMKDYIIINSTRGKIISKMTLSNLQEILPANKFLRIHKSFIVAISKLTAISGSSVEIGKKELTIGRTYKERVYRILKIN